MVKPIIETVVFDLGGVLIHVDYHRAVDWLWSHGCRIESIEEFIDRSGLSAHERGELSGEQFYQRIAGLLQPGVSSAELHRWWTGFFRPNAAMLDLARQLGKRHRVAILSNTGSLHWAQAVEQFDLNSLASVSLTSFEAGVTKPEPRIYALAEEKFGLQPERTVFIDDLPANSEAAQAAGWHGIRHRDVDDTRIRLAELGVS